MPKTGSMFKLLPILFLFISASLSSQTVQNFTVTDYNDNLHNLYNDYLNQGKTVVLKIFFTTCPPCQAQAPSFEALYQDWGAGQGDVAFFEISNKTWDSNLAVSNYATVYGTSMPGVGNDGGAQSAITQFTNGTYGTFWGTPSYAVIAPNGSVDWDLGLFELDAAIAATGAIGLQEISSSYTFEIVDPNGNPANYTSSQILMKSLSNSSYSLDISPFLNNGEFIYPSDDIPEIENPTLQIIDNTPGSTGASALDLILIQKHLLLIETLDNPYHLLAADVNNSNSLSAVDLIELQKVILGVFSSFPNNQLFRFYFVDCNNCTVLNMPYSPNETYTLQLVKVTTGDVN